MHSLGSISAIASEKNIFLYFSHMVCVNTMTCGGGHKMFQNASSLNPLGQLKPNCPGMIIGRSSTKLLFFMPIGNPRWPPPQVIVLTQTIWEKYKNIFFSEAIALIEPKRYLADSCKH
jgi:hypothetical protein